MSFSVQKLAKQVSHQTVVFAEGPTQAIIIPPFPLASCAVEAQQRIYLVLFRVDLA